MAKGNFIEYVVSDNPNKYPNDGEQGDYYYEKMFDPHQLLGLVALMKKLLKWLNLLMLG